jgi:GABA permease
MVHTCPRCDLRFERDAEMRDHLDRDHDVDARAFEPMRYAGRAGARPAQSGGRRVLVVANRTLHSDELLTTIRDISSGGPATFFLLVPADHSGGEEPEEAIRLAEWRLRHLVDRLHGEGIDAEGEIGHSDPFRAVEHALERRDYDEIILSTLPPALSRWMAADLAARLERNFGVQVRRVQATV